jgi:hypothetical protein
MSRSPRRFAVLSFAFLSPVCLGAALALLPAASAADEPEEKWLVDRSMTVAPARAPVPALKYRLFPMSSERKEGNAVPMYLRFAHERNDASKRYFYETPDRLNKLPLDRLPLDEAKEYLKRWKYNIKQLELGARRKTAEWNYAFDAVSPIEILLPDVQEMRMQAPMLVLKARVEMAEGRYDEAIRTLETGLSFSQQISEGPFFINNLVAIAIAYIMLNQVPDLIERPGSPNLYWALTALPRPLIDLRKSMELEQRILEMQFPDLADLDRPRTPEQWDAALARVRKEAERIGALVRGKETRPGTSAADPAAKSPDLPAAKKYLVEVVKTPAAAVDAMPPAQVLLLYMLHYSREVRDGYFKAAYLPYAESLPIAREAEKRLKDAPDTEAKRLVHDLLPVFTKVRGADVRIQRLIALLQAVEALRMYAAAHGGRLPDKLEQVTEAPVPKDPGTERPFEYQHEGQTALLASRLPGEPLMSTGMRIRLSVKK